METSELGRPLPLWGCSTCVSTEDTSFNVESWAKLVGGGRDVPGAMAVDGFVSFNSYNRVFNLFLMGPGFGFQR